MVSKAYLAFLLPKQRTQHFFLIQVPPLAALGLYFSISIISYANNSHKHACFDICCHLQYWHESSLTFLQISNYILITVLGLWYLHSKQQMSIFNLTP